MTLFRAILPSACQVDYQLVGAKKVDYHHWESRGVVPGAIHFPKRFGIEIIQWLENHLNVKLMSSSQSIQPGNFRRNQKTAAWFLPGYKSFFPMSLLLIWEQVLPFHARGATSPRKTWSSWKVKGWGVPFKGWEKKKKLENSSRNSTAQKIQQKSHHVFLLYYDTS